MKKIKLLFFAMAGLMFIFRAAYGLSKEELNSEIYDANSREQMFQTAVSMDKILDSQIFRAMVDVFGERVRVEIYATRPAFNQLKQSIFNLRANRTDYGYALATFDEDSARKIDRLLEDRDSFYNVVANMGYGVNAYYVDPILFEKYVSNGIDYVKDTYSGFKQGFGYINLKREINGVVKLEGKFDQELTGYGYTQYKWIPAGGSITYSIKFYEDFYNTYGNQISKYEFTKRYGDGTFETWAHYWNNRGGNEEIRIQYIITATEFDGRDINIAFPGRNAPGSQWALDHNRIANVYLAYTEGWFDTWEILK